MWKVLFPLILFLFDLLQLVMKCERSESNKFDVSFQYFHNQFNCYIKSIKSIESLFTPAVYIFGLRSGRQNLFLVKHYFCGVQITKYPFSHFFLNEYLKGKAFVNTRSGWQCVCNIVHLGTRGRCCSLSQFRPYLQIILGA